MELILTRQRLLTDTRRCTCMALRMGRVILADVRAPMVAASGGINGLKITSRSMQYEYLVLVLILISVCRQLEKV